VFVYLVGPVITRAQKIEDQQDFAVFNCSATGLPRPNITWTIRQNNGMSSTSIADFNISTIIGADDRLITSILTISIVQPVMAATYVCTASNFLGRDIADIDLIDPGKFKFLD